MKKRTLTLISSFFESPYHKNRAPYNEQLFLELSRSYQIKIIRPIAWTDIVRFKKSGELLNVIGKKWNNIPILFPTFFYLPRIGLRFNGIMYFIAILLPFLKQKQIPDIFYSTWAYPDSYAAMLLAKLVGRPYIVRVHGSDINDLSCRPVLKPKIIRVLSNAALVISPSQALKNKIINLGVSEEKIKVIYSGVNNKKFYPMDKVVAEKELNLHHKKRILYIGNFKEAKGVIDILKAVIDLSTKRKDFELCLIGKGECLQLLNDEICNNDLSKLVKIIGAVDHDDLVTWINASNCVCLPSYAEGVPNVLLESMACKTNILASNVGGIPEIISDPEQNLIFPGDIKELMGKLDKLLDVDGFITAPKVKLRSYEQVSQEISLFIENISAT